MYDFTPMIFTVPMWGSKVAGFKTEIHIKNTASEVMRLCYVTTIEHEGEWCICILLSGNAWTIFQA